MAIPTSRATAPATILVDYDKCNGCANCVKVCKDFNFAVENGKVAILEHPLFGCIGCGHCMMICPVGAIKIRGRELSETDVFELADAANATKYDALLSLLQNRRSIREFNEKAVEKDVVDKILEAAQTAPMGLPPSDVHVVLFENRAVVRSFAVDYAEFLKHLRWMVSSWFLALMRPFYGKANDEMMRGFLKPVFDIYVDSMQKGDNWITYDAPLAMYFYGSPYCDPADPVIAATYAMIAGESLGLGTCMLGAIHPFIQNGKRARRFRQKYGIKYPSREGLFVIFGYAAVKYKKGVKRTFANIHSLS